MLIRNIGYSISRVCFLIWRTIRCHLLRAALHQSGRVYMRMLASGYSILLPPCGFSIYVKFGTLVPPVREFCARRVLRDGAILPAMEDPPQQEPLTYGVLLKRMSSSFIYPIWSALVWVLTFEIFVLFVRCVHFSYKTFATHHCQSRPAPRPSLLECRYYFRFTHLWCFVLLVWHIAKFGGWFYTFFRVDSGSVREINYVLRHVCRF